VLTVLKEFLKKFFPHVSRHGMTECEYSH